MKKSLLKNINLLILCVISFVIASGLFLSVPKTNALAEEKSITVFSWEDYIEEVEEGEGLGVLDEFTEETGIKVNYYTFATCEEMYNELKKDPTACDIICPSEYMILKMKEEGLIKEYQMPENYINHASPYIKGVFEDLGLANGDKTYAVGYMWGTMGFIYNMDVFSAEELGSWSNLYDEKFAGKVTIKDSVRDTYIMTLGIVYKDELNALKGKLQNGDITEREYSEKLGEIFNRTDRETVNKVKNALVDLKGNLYGFEVDGGKNDILTGKIDVNFAWSGDAAYAIYESDGSEDYSKLGYVVPEEGSNIWFDGWVLTKDADEENALQFIDFMSRPDIAVRNMDYVGYTSCIAGTEDTSVFDYIVDCYGDEEGEYQVDLKYFFDPDCTTGDYIVKTNEIGRQFSAQYPTEDVILRCSVMDNFSTEDLEIINEMWNEVKLITLPTPMLIAIVIVLVLLIALYVVYVFREKLFGKTDYSKKHRKVKKGYKVIKIDNLD